MWSLLSNIGWISRGNGQTCACDFTVLTASLTFSDCDRSTKFLGVLSIVRVSSTRRRSSLQMTISCVQYWIRVGLDVKYTELRYFSLFCVSFEVIFLYRELRGKTGFNAPGSLSPGMNINRDLEAISGNWSRMLRANDSNLKKQSEKMAFLSDFLYLHAFVMFYRY